MATYMLTRNRQNVVGPTPRQELQAAEGCWEETVSLPGMSLLIGQPVPVVSLEANTACISYQLSRSLGLTGTLA